MFGHIFSYKFPKMTTEMKVSIENDSLLSKKALKSNDEEVIDIPKSKDVLLGRGAACLRHPGNRLFREIIDKALPNYEKTSSRAHKVKIITIIYDSVTSNQGRFLKQDKETKKWHSVEKNHVSEKIAHAIRDRRASLEKAKSETKHGIGFNASPNDGSRENVFLNNSPNTPSRNSAAIDLLITIASIRSRLKAAIPAIQVMKHQSHDYSSSRNYALPANQSLQLRPGKAMLPITQDSVTHTLHIRNQIEYHKRLIAHDTLSKLSNKSMLTKNLPLPQLVLDDLSSNQSQPFFQHSFSPFSMERRPFYSRPY
jgi:hypothetical protein